MQNGRNDRSSSFCARISSGVFSRRASVGGGLGKCARPVASVVAVEHRLAVAADHLDARAVDRKAGADRLHEDVAAAVLRLLHDEAEVGDENQPRVFERARRRGSHSGSSSLIGVSVPVAMPQRADVQQEQAAAGLPVLLQVLAESMLS